MASTQKKLGGQRGRIRGESQDLDGDCWAGAGPEEQEAGIFQTDLSLEHEIQFVSNVNSA